MTNKKTHDIIGTGKSSLYFAKNMHEKIREAAKTLGVSTAQELFNALVENYTENPAENSTETNALREKIGLLELENDGLKTMLEESIDKREKLRNRIWDLEKTFDDLKKEVIEYTSIKTNADFFLIETNKNLQDLLDDPTFEIDFAELVELMIDACQTDPSEVFPRDEALQPIYERKKQQKNDVSTENLE